MHIAVWAWCPAFQSMASYGSMYGELVQANFAKKIQNKVHCDFDLIVNFMQDYHGSNMARRQHEHDFSYLHVRRGYRQTDRV